MNHIHSGPATVISLLRTNLNDRYGSGFPVLKELIQNADDAGAKTLRLGWAAARTAPGDHPLLSGPALFAVNDGPFDRRNARAIYEVGLSSKSSDTATIGKFGLGMKSVFHFSEAVYYLAKCDQLEGGEVSGQLNPWCAPGMQVPPVRQGWVAFEADHHRWLRERLGDLLPISQHFLLWMPLRLTRHHDRQSPPLIVANFDAYLGATGGREDNIFVPGHIEETAGLLPMLHDLETIEVWRLEADGLARRISTVRLGEGPVSRCARPDRMTPGWRARLGGEVWAETGARAVHAFGGTTTLLDTPVVRALSESEYWPSGLRIEGDEFVSSPEKAPPHVGVCWRRRPAAGAPRLSCSWAVYLPLSDEPERVDLEGQWSYSLLLHGWFFVDAGRKLFRLEGGNAGRVTDESSLRREWNRELMTAGTLPLIPASLIELQGSANLTAGELRQLVAGVEKAAVFTTHRAAVCSDKQCIYRWRAGGANWELVGAQESIIELAAPEGDLNPAEALSGLAESAGRLTLTFTGWPRLASREQADAWPEHEVAAVLGSADPERLFADPARLAYVAEFCARSRAKAGAVRPLLRRLLARPLKELGERAEALARLLKRVPTDQRLAIPLKDEPAGRELWQRLENLPLSILLVPQMCEADIDPGTATPVLDDGEAILRAVALKADEQTTAAGEEIRSQIAQLVLERAGPDRSRDLLGRCGGLALFRVWEPEDEKEQAALRSWADLDSRCSRGALFKRQPATRSGAVALRKALPREPVTLITDRLGEILFGPNAVPTCDAEGCSRAILRQTETAALAEVGRRGDLLDYFLKAPSGDSPSLARAAAALLHGRLPPPPEQPGLLVNGGGADPLWSAITKDVLARTGESWRLVEHSLSRRVPEVRYHEFSLSSVDRSGVVRLLEEQAGREGPEGVALSLTAGQREELLGALHVANKPALLKRLRIHVESVTGDAGGEPSLHAITARSYWADGLALAPEFRPHVTLLRLSDNPALQSAQQLLAPTWDTRAAAEVILDRLDPADHWATLIEALSRSGGWPHGLLERLRNTAWLPRAGGGPAVQPCDVISLEPIRETVSRALGAAHTKAFVDYLALDRRVLGPGPLAVLARTVLPSAAAALEMLGEVLGEDEVFRVGCVPELTQPAGLNRFREVFATVPVGVMAAAPVVAEVVREYTGEACVEGLLKPLRQPVSAARLRRILDFLTRQHEESQGSSERRGHLSDAHGWYLRELAAHGEPFRDALAGTEPLRLLSRAGHWKPATELCLGAENIDGACRLDDRQRALVASHLPAAAKEAPAVPEVNLSKPGQDRNWDDGTKRAAEELQTYFRPWLTHRPGLQVVIGGFLAILCGNPTVRQLAQRYLGNNYTVANVRRRLRLPKDRYDRTVEDQVEQYLVVVQREKSQTIAVNNLAGHEITVPLSAQVENLFVFHSPASPFERSSERADTKSYRVVRLREFDPSSVGDDRLVDLLRKAAGTIVAEFYNQRLGTGLDELFKGLEEDDIHQIRVAEMYLLEHAPASLRQFDLSAQPRLRELLRRMDEVHRLQAEENVVAAARGQEVERRSEAQRRQVQQEFREALNDPAVCAVLLDAVRRKINGHYQYSEASVPFELLQNADDACVEFERVGGVPGDWFGVARDEGTLSFLHAGRPINVTAPGDTALAESGFHRDLEKMLMLSTSDKQTGPDTPCVTGKFGLGFKSVFLVSDEPRVLSRALGFEVAGGLLPRPLSADERGQGGERYRRLTGSDVLSAQGTIVSLPLRQGIVAETVLERFRLLLPVQLAFTRRIRKCHLHGLSAEQPTTEWREQAVPHADGWSCGLLDGPDRTSPLRRRPAAVLRLGGNRDVLLALDHEGFRALPDEIPSIWATAPTGHEEKVGAAVNAPFALDVGRAQLFRDVRTHLELADDLGRGTGEALVRLFDAASDRWEEIRPALHLHADADPLGLWRSLWRVLGEGMARRARTSDSEALAVLLRIFWGGAGHGLRRLYEQRSALPTGFETGRHAVLTRRERIERRLTGWLDEEPAAFERAAAWAQARTRLAPGSVVSGSRVWEPLRQLGAVDDRQASPVDSAHLIEWELGADGLVTPERAAALGAVVTPALLQRLENATTHLPEARRIREALQAARFVTRAGTDEPAERLLVATPTSDRRDEARRAAFAPGDRVLTAGYEGPGLDFFFACRVALKADVSDLIAWGRLAEGEQRVRFLEYVNDGELSSALSRALRQQDNESDWWRSAEEFGKAAAGTQQIDQVFVGAVVGQAPQPTLLPAVPADETQIPVLDPSDILPRLAQWWRDHRAVWLPRYCARVYPNFVTLTTQHTLSLSLDELPTDLQVRKRWLSLFILGMTPSLGRGGRYGQQHRSFLELCERRKWLDVFADPQVTERRGDWVALVDDYLDRQRGDPEYYHCLRQLFLSIRAVAVRLADYAEAFRALRSKGDVRLGDVLRPRNSPVFQGGGVDPPSLARVLSLGACFVVRELVRGGFLRSRTQVHPFCYPPVRSVRRWLRSLVGCPDLEADIPDSWSRSEMIHAFLAKHLEDPTFCGDFDIPLWLVSREPDAQAAFGAVALPPDDGGDDGE